MRITKPVMTFFPSCGKWVCRSFKGQENTFIAASENWGIAFGAWHAWQMLNPGK